MRETEKRCALIVDIDPHTLARFGEYMYTGNYHAADHHVIFDGDSIVESASTTVQGETHHDMTVGSGMIGTAKLI